MPATLDKCSTVGVYLRRLISVDTKLRMVRVNATIDESYRPIGIAVIYTPRLVVADESPCVVNSGELGPVLPIG